MIITAVVVLTFAAFVVWVYSGARKAGADHFFTDAGVPTTFLLTSFYWENFIFFGMGPARGEDGVLGITFPMGDARPLPVTMTRLPFKRALR